jgi:predicted transcriptional regulator
MDKELEVAGQFDQMNKVVEELLKGNSPLQISKSLGITRAQVDNYIDAWKGFVHDNNAIRDRAKEALAGADEHYSMLIKEAWDVVNQAGVTEELNTKNAALKLIADIEAKRIDMLNKAGVLEDNSMADQILESERKQEILVNILRDVTSNCDHCKWEVSKRLSEVTGQVEAVVITE